jgi:hypothetical protein
MGNGLPGGTTYPRIALPSIRATMLGAQGECNAIPTFDRRPHADDCAGETIPKERIFADKANPNIHTTKSPHIIMR